MLLGHCIHQLSGAPSGMATVGALHGELRGTPVVLGCRHGYAVVGCEDDESWTCDAGHAHTVEETMLVDVEYGACLDALVDFAESEHPSALAEYRSAYREMMRADQAKRVEVQRAFAVAAEVEIRRSEGIVGAFMRGLLH
jgi:hypothetical protein